MEEANKEVEVDKVEVDKVDVTVSEEDRKEYYRAILGLRPFTRVWELMDGKLEVECSSLTVTETEAMEDAILRDSSKDSGGMAYVKAKMCALVRRMKINDKTITFEFPEGAEWTPSGVYRERFGTFPDPLMYPLVNKTGEFQRLVAALAKETSSQDF